MANPHGMLSIFSLRFLVAAHALRFNPLASNSGSSSCIITLALLNLLLGQMLTAGKVMFCTYLLLITVATGYWKYFLKAHWAVKTKYAPETSSKMDQSMRETSFLVGTTFRIPCRVVFSRNSLHFSEVLQFSSLSCSFWLESIFICILVKLWPVNAKFSITGKRKVSNYWIVFCMPKKLNVNHQGKVHIQSSITNFNVERLTYVFVGVFVGPRFTVSILHLLRWSLWLLRQTRGLWNNLKGRHVFFFVFTYLSCKTGAHCFSRFQGFCVASFQNRLFCTSFIKRCHWLGIWGCVWGWTSTTNCARTGAICLRLASSYALLGLRAHLVRTRENVKKKNYTNKQKGLFYALFPPST